MSICTSSHPLYEFNGNYSGFDVDLPDEFGDVGYKVLNLAAHDEDAPRGKLL